MKKLENENHLIGEAVAETLQDIRIIGKPALHRRTARKHKLGSTMNSSRNFYGTDVALFHKNREIKREQLQNRAQMHFHVIKII